MQAYPEPIGGTVDAIRAALSWLAHQGPEQLPLAPEKVNACFDHCLTLEANGIAPLQGIDRIYRMKCNNILDL